MEALGLGPLPPRCLVTGVGIEDIVKDLDDGWIVASEEPAWGEDATEMGEVLGNKQEDSAKLTSS